MVNNKKLSKEFIERHENDVLWSLMYKFQNLSAGFKSQHHFNDYREALNDSTEKHGNKLQLLLNKIKRYII